MLASLRPYQNSIDTKLSGLGNIPAHWSTSRIKNAAILNPSKTESRSILSEHDSVSFLPMEGVSNDGRVLRNRIEMASAVWNGFTYFSRGDVLVAKITPCFENGKGACLDELPTQYGFGSTEFHVLRPKGAILPRYLHRITTLDEFRRAGAEAMIGAAGQQRVPANFLSNYIIPIPPVAEQAAIVRFLDHADRKIRRYIRAKQKLIKLLEEQKQAIIHRAVTRGLDPGVPLKPSGIDWLGDIPAHWSGQRLKWVLRLQRGYDLPADKRVRGAVPVYSSGGLIDYHDVAIANPPGIVIGRYGSTAATFYITEAYWPHNTALFTTEFYGNDPRWCYWLLRSIPSGAHSGKSAVPGIDRKDLFDIVVPLPPLPEQTSISRYLDAEMDRHQLYLRRYLNDIDLMVEFRTRLVADVVTGKLDVRGAVASLSEELDNSMSDGVEDSEPEDILDAADEPSEYEE